jgi:DNA-binding SARP family transcriptional activator
MPDQPGASPYELTLLGGFAFSVGGNAVPRISVGSQHLLAFLAVREQLVARHLVAATLWPESADVRASASLRAAISRLEDPVRQAVKMTPNELGLAEGVAVDVHHSRALARRLIAWHAPRSETDIDAVAVAALSDDLLPGWYDDWAVIAAEDWHQLRIHALEEVAARLTAADRLAEAAAAALAAVRAEPLRESARAALIRVHIAEGNKSEATLEYERYRVLLRAELGLAPTVRLTQLLARLDPR